MFAITVDCVILYYDNNQEYVLLVQRASDPFAGFWALPGGYVEISETFVGAALRELKEETGLEGIDLKLIGVFDTINRDPAKRVISIGYMGIVAEQKIELGFQTGEVLKLEWFNTHILPMLAFDHLTIIKNALNNNE